MSDFTTIRVAGAALPADVLTRAATGKELPGLGGDDYLLELHVTPREAANRAWSVLTGAWRGFREAFERLPEGDTATALTRSKWLLIVLRELGFGVVRTTPAGGLAADDRSFVISHEAPGGTPLHLLGWGVDLDRRSKGVAGAAERAPHVLLQEYLNRSPDALWGIVSNGKLLRLLRDSSTMVGQSFVEFDLEAMFDGEVFSDFVALYLTCHATRFDVRDEQVGPASCWIEQWRTFAAAAGTRALQGLRSGVARAIEALGSGFLDHPANGALRDGLRDGTITDRDLHQSLLRLVYRLLFCFVAEDRGLLVDPAADPLARQRFDQWFSTSRLRRIAQRRRGTRHADLWEAMRLVLHGLGRDEGRPELGLRGLGGLFDLGAADVTAPCALSNEALLSAVRHLSVVQPPGGGPRRSVDYRNLGAEELGGVYESLLELVPRVDLDHRRVTLEALAGNDRKTTGSYYTPTSLIDCVLDSALDPLLDAAERSADPQGALLAITVCDPACGSGHFLVAAAKRIAARLALVRAGGMQPSVLDEQEAMAEVVGRCIYGVDLNPLAAELAKVSLWLESVQPGRALSFLDAQIKVGNALLGTTPRLLAEGIPDAAYTALDGDDRKAVASLKKRNALERGNVTELFTADTITVETDTLRDAVEAITAKPATSLLDVHLAEQRFRQFDRSPELRRRRLVADAWCAAFVVPKKIGDAGITQGVLRRLDDPTTTTSADDPGAALVTDVATQYRFFHWHVEFPQIFHVDDATAATTPNGWTGGFTCVVGNPPWEQVQVDAREYFAARDESIANAPNHAARERMIAALAESNPNLHAHYFAVKRTHDGLKHFVHASGRFPKTAFGRLNTYSLFAEHKGAIIAERGRVGTIVPTGIATDSFNQYYFKDLVAGRTLVSLYDFENRQQLFDGVDSRMKFCVLTVGGRDAEVERAEFAFFLQSPDELANEERRFVLAPDELILLNPNTGTCPIFRSRRDSEITLAIYRRWPILIRDDDPDGNPWGLSFQLMFMMNTDSHRFHTRAQLEADGWTLTGNVFTKGDERMLPMYEDWMVHHFDHRVQSDGAQFHTDEEKVDPSLAATPRYWLTRDEVALRLDEATWHFGFRNRMRPTDVRSFIGTVIPLAAAGNVLPLLSVMSGVRGAIPAVFSSFALDYALRQKAGGMNLNFFIAKQLPVPPPTAFAELCPWSPDDTYVDWITSRVLELTYTAWDIEPFARDLGETGAPFRWDTERRARLRAELDACFFHLYGLDRSDTGYVLSTFPIANRNDPFLTRRVMASYDALAAAAATGSPFTSPLDPPPGSGPRHPPRNGD